MFRLHRSDQLALAVILAAAAFGLSLQNGTNGGFELPTLRSSAASAPTPASVLAAGSVRTPVRGPGVALDLSSTATGFSVVGQYSGWISLEDGDLVFRVPEATLRTRSDTNGRQTLVGVRVALARASGDGWRTVHESPLFPVRQRLEKGRSYTLHDLELRIGGLRSLDLRDTWPVLVHELDVRATGPENYSGPAWTYVHGEAAIMDALRSKAEESGD